MVNRKSLLFIISFIFVALVQFSFGQEFVGSEACKTCHSGYYDDWAASGHPYKFTIIKDATPPTYPEFVMNFQDTWMDSLGDGTHTWDDIAGVIGGFGWKTRFVGPDGVIIGTASSQFDDAGLGHNQINFFGGEFHSWSNYNASTENKLYNYGCFKCHTTGGTTDGTWLEGVAGLGTFSEGGIGCESCHGPGSDHASSPSKSNIDLVYEFVHADNSIGGLELDGEVIMPSAESDDVNYLCGTCHNRSYTDPINSKGGFIRHHEQWDEFVSQKHFAGGMDCVTCHDPHKRVLWDGPGITKMCQDCHGSVTQINHPEGLDCIDCHMPYAAKSGTAIGESGFRGDVRTHVVAITVNTESMFTEDGSAMRDDAERAASLSPNYTCLGCHNDKADDGIPNITLETAVAAAAGMHMATAIEENDLSINTFELKQNYPNPFNPKTQIEFTLPVRSFVQLNVFNLSGQLVKALINNNMDAGVQQVTFNANELPSGVYMYKLVTKNYTASKKMVLIK